MDVHSQAQRRRNMQAIRSKNTKIEVLLGQALWKAGFRYRKHSSKILGKPDFSMKKYKIVIFCDSEFWHGKNWEVAQHKIGSNKEFWLKKIQGNIDRDIKVNLELKKQGWTVLRFWEKEIKKNLQKCLQIVEEAIAAARISK